MKGIRFVHRWIGLVCGLFLFVLCATGAVIAFGRIAGVHSPIMDWCMRLHRSLMLGSAGNFVVALATLLIVVEILTGYWIWIDEARKVGVRRSLTWNFPNKRWGLHCLAGVWAGIPLLIMAVTGVIIFDPDGAGHVTRLVHQLHTGSWWGYVTRYLWFGAAILGATLPITGLLLTLRKP